MFVNLKTTQPYDTDTNLPISVADLKTRMRISTTSEDDFIKECIKTATISLETFTRRSFVEQEHILTIDYVSGLTNDIVSSSTTIYLGKPPVLSVTSVVFYDSDNVATTIDSSDYFVDKENGRIKLISGKTWPSSQRDLNSVKITYKAGIVADTSGATLNPKLITAIANLAYYFYEHRMAECEIPNTIKKIAKQFQLSRIGKPYCGVYLDEVR